MCFRARPARPSSARPARPGPVGVRRRRRLRRRPGAHQAPVPAPARLAERPPRARRRPPGRQRRLARGPQQPRRPGGAPDGHPRREGGPDRGAAPAARHGRQPAHAAALAAAAPDPPPPGLCRRARGRPHQGARQPGLHVEERGLERTGPLCEGAGEGAGTVRRPGQTR